MGLLTQEDKSKEVLNIQLPKVQGKNQRKAIGKPAGHIWLNEGICHCCFCLIHVPMPLLPVYYLYADPTNCFQNWTLCFGCTSSSPGSNTSFSQQWYSCVWIHDRHSSL